MKKNLLGWLAMATMLVGTGCSTDEVVNDYSPENAIQFGTYVGRDAQGRAQIVDNEGENGNLLFNNFGVFAFYRNEGVTVAAPNFMNNQSVFKSSENWQYTPVKYWPNESTDFIDFYAYAPYDASKVWNENTINLSVPENLSEQKDYLVANPALNLNKKGIEDKVLLQFGHAMSRVGFKVEAVIDEVNNQVDGNKGDADGQNNLIADGTVISVQEVKLIGNFYETADLNLVTRSWDYTNAELYSTSPVEYVLGTSNFNESVANQVLTSSGVLNNASSYLMLIPKNFTGDDKINLYVKYTVTTTDSKLNGNSVVENKITSLPFNFNFEQGKAYNFVLHLGLTSVKLTATVGDWVEAEDVVANVPINFAR